MLKSRVSLLISSTRPDSTQRQHGLFLDTLWPNAALKQNQLVCVLYILIETYSYPIINITIFHNPTRYRYNYVQPRDQQLPVPWSSALPSRCCHPECTLSMAHARQRIRPCRSMDWFCWENLNQKPPWSELENRRFPVEFSLKPIHWVEEPSIV